MSAPRDPKTGPESHGPPLSGNSLATRFDALTSLLREGRPLWAPRPFTGLPVAWEADRPRLASWLRERTDEEIDALEGEPHLPSDAPGFGEWTHRLRSVCGTGPVPTFPSALPAHLSRHVPGRKWDQIQAFVPAALGARTPRTTQLVDWCAGKGHLARTVGAVSKLPAVAVEHQVHLCETGARFAERAAVDVTFDPRDVLDAPRPEALTGDSLAVSLHACGVLTDRLLQHVVETGAGVAAAMCCYHNLAGATVNTPLSARGRAAGLELSQHELRLAILDETVAPSRERSGRRQEMSHRLGLDLLLREAGAEAYRPLGPIPKSELRRPFAEFCRAATERLNLELPQTWDPDVAERAGVERAHAVRALALVRGAFRRPLELWLVLDRALYLLEAGRDVSVGTFCTRALTPRNLLIRSP